MQCRDFRQWGGCRSTWAVTNDGQAYYEVGCRDEGLSRFGFGTDKAQSLEIAYPQKLKKKMKFSANLKVENKNRNLQDFLKVSQF